MDKSTCVFTSFLFHISCHFLVELFPNLMGTSGLEPPTSRLSGVRSNHLSYAPILKMPLGIFKISSFALRSMTSISQAKPQNIAGLIIFFSIDRIRSKCLSNSFWCFSSYPYLIPFFAVLNALGNHFSCLLPLASCFCRGGDEEDRTPDPLLAKQVLSQLSYTPAFQGPQVLHIPFFKLPFGTFKIEQ